MKANENPKPDPALTTASRLALLTALAGGYLLTNVGGLTFTNLGAWRTPFIVGLVAGTVLFVAAARALLKDQRSTQHA